MTYQYQEDVDEDLPNEIVAELDAQEQAESNVQDEDDYVFSDAVQDAFKKYQNEVKISRQRLIVIIKMTDFDRSEHVFIADSLGVD